jgi:putative drug exporter of the RND superfamily
MRTLYSSTWCETYREPASRLARLGQTTARRGGWFLALWLTVAAGLGGIGTQFGGVFRDELTVPHSDSQRAVEILEAKFPASAGSAVRIVFRTPVGSVHDPASAKAISASLVEVRGGRHVVAVDDPLAPGRAPGFPWRSDRPGYCHL